MRMILGLGRLRGKQALDGYGLQAVRRRGIAIGWRSRVAFGGGVGTAWRASAFWCCRLLGRITGSMLWRRRRLRWRSGLASSRLRERLVDLPGLGGGLRRSG